MAWLTSLASHHRELPQLLGRENWMAGFGPLCRFPSGTLYGVSLSDASQCYEIDTQTGAATPIGPTDIYIAVGALALDPTDSQLYGARGGGLALDLATGILYSYAWETRELMSTNIATGDATVLHQFPVGTRGFTAFAIDASNPTALRNVTWGHVKSEYC